MFPISGGIVEILACMAKHFLLPIGGGELLKVLDQRVKIDSGEIGDFLASP